MSLCKYCNATITWMKDGRKSVPVEHDGTTHKCDVMKDSLKSLKSLEPKSLTDEEIKKYEDAMNEKAKK